MLPCPHGGGARGADGSSAPPSWADGLCGVRLGNSSRHTVLRACCGAGRGLTPVHTPALPGQTGVPQTEYGRRTKWF